MKFRLNPLAYLIMLAISNSIAPAHAADEIPLPVTTAYPDALKDQLPDFEHAAGKGVTFEGPRSTYTGTTPPPPALDVNTTEKNTLINWGGRGFDVGADATVNFKPGVSGAAILNYDTSGNMSIVNGGVNANGAKLFLVNPDGISDTSGSFTALIANDAENVTLGNDGRLRIKNAGDRIYGSVSGPVDTQQDLTVDLVNGSGVNTSNMILGGNNTTINISNPDSGNNLISNTQFAANQTEISANKGSAATLQLQKTSGGNLTVNNFDVTEVSGQTDLSNVTVNNPSVLSTFRSASANGELNNITVNNGSVDLVQSGGTLVIDGLKHSTYIGNFEAEVSHGAVLDIRNSSITLNSDGDIEDSDSLPTAALEEREIDNSALVSTDTGGGVISITNSAILAEGSIYFEDDQKVGTLNLTNTDLLVPEGNVMVTPGTKITMSNGFALDSDFDPSGYTRGVIVVDTTKTEGKIDAGKQYYKVEQDYSNFSSDKTIKLAFNQINASGGGAMENRSEFESAAANPAPPADIPNIGDGQETDPPVVDIPEVPSDGTDPTLPGDDGSDTDPGTGEDDGSGTQPGDDTTTPPGGDETTPGTGGGVTTPGTGEGGTGTDPGGDGTTEPGDGDTGTTPGTDPDDGSGDDGSQPGETDPGTDTGTDTGTDPDDGTGGSDNGGTDPAPTPGDGETTTPGEGDTGTTPGTDPDDGTGTGGSDEDGTDPTPTPGEGDTGTTPGTDPNDGADPAPTPGEGETGVTPGTDPDEGTDPAPTPGDGETTTPGEGGTGATPGTDPGNGTDPVPTPGDGETTTPGGGDTGTNPGTDPNGGTGGSDDGGTTPVPTPGDGETTTPGEGETGTTPGKDPVGGGTTEPGAPDTGTTPGTDPDQGTGGEGTEPVTPPETDPDNGTPAEPGTGDTGTLPGSDPDEGSGSGGSDGGSTTPVTPPGGGSTTEPGTGEGTPETDPSSGSGGSGGNDPVTIPGADPVPGDTTPPDTGAGGSESTPGTTPGQGSGESGSGGSDSGSGSNPAPDQDNGTLPDDSTPGSTPGVGGNGGESTPPGSGESGSGPVTGPGEGAGSTSPGNDGSVTPPGNGGSSTPGTSAGGEAGNSSGAPGHGNGAHPGQGGAEADESVNQDIIDRENTDPLIDELLESPDNKRLMFDEKSKECEDADSSQGSSCEQIEVL
ncbi:filamentous hemagglutinin N-terminal domain-containing protein [Pseudomonas viridiflava]|uniref:filamentous hemagglutinin N-terminal domain-containing protein n=1 Tax=Pseudomonas viridiflava TaxID=33069 RepID=UPI000F022473|nr:filamentous hemagglutinin N-terminal domain-containing protein [Pseudomonas viridiflava]